MLNQQTLENQLKKAFEDILPIAFEQAAQVLIPSNSNAGNDMCKEFGQTISNILSESLASSLSAAIDYYVKTISLQGTIMTTGTPVAQQAVILPAPNPMSAGVIPNTLKVV